MSNAWITNDVSAARAAAAVANTDKFLSFCLGREEFGLEILSVREIIGLIDITPLPQTPDYVKGVINLRGKIIPVIELRTKFGMPPVDYTDQTCVIVVEVPGGESDECFQLGVIVDCVREVLDINSTQIDAPPSFGSHVPLDFIMGIGKIRERVVMLLNAGRIASISDLGGITQAWAGEEGKAVVAA